VIKDCAGPVGEEALTKLLLSKGFLKATEKKGPYIIFKKANIIKKSPFASSVYEDLSRPFGIAVCTNPNELYLAIEEFNDCKENHCVKNYTVENQDQVVSELKSLQCKVNASQTRSESWKLEDRQDYNVQTCGEIMKGLSL
jgi:hypothetical protein